MSVNHTCIECVNGMLKRIGSCTNGALHKWGRRWWRPNEGELGEVVEHLEHTLVLKALGGTELLKFVDGSWGFTQEKQHKRSNTVTLDKGAPLWNYLIIAWPNYFLVFFIINSHFITVTWVLQSACPGFLRIALVEMVLCGTVNPHSKRENSTCLLRICPSVS